MVSRALFLEFASIDPDRAQIHDFVRWFESQALEQYTLDPGLDGLARSVVREVANQNGFYTKSSGRGINRRLTISRKPDVKAMEGTDGRAGPLRDGRAFSCSPIRVRLQSLSVGLEARCNGRRSQGPRRLLARLPEAALTTTPRRLSVSLQPPSVAVGPRAVVPWVTQRPP